MISDFKTEICCISIFNSERYFEFIKYIKQIPIQVRLIEAITSKNEDFLDRKNFFNYENHKVNHNGKMPTDLEIACSLSHLNAIKFSTLNRNLLILEDDARLKINAKIFNIILSELEKINFYDIVILGFSKSDIKSENYINMINPFLGRFKLRINNHEYYIGDRYFHTTSGELVYFINSSAKNKLTNLSKIYHLADDWNLLSELGMKIGYLNSTIFQEDTDLKSSLNHSQNFIRPRRTKFPFINFLFFLRRILLFYYRKARLLIKHKD